MNRWQQLKGGPNAHRQVNLAATIALAVLSLIFLVVPFLTGRPRPTLVGNQPQAPRPTVSDYLAQAALEEEQKTAPPSSAPKPPVSQPEQASAPKPQVSQPEQASAPKPQVSQPEQASAPKPQESVGATPELQQSYQGPVRPTPSEPAAAAPEAGWPPVDTEPAWAPSSDFVSRLQHVSLVLVLMSGLIYLTLKLGQRWFPQWFKTQKATTPLMQVLERQQLAPGTSLALVRVAERMLVVAIGTQGTNTLCELSGEELNSFRARQEQERQPEEPPVKPSEVYGGILRHYLSIIPGMGVPKR